jgi:hypothetical protein
MDTPKTPNKAIIALIVVALLVAAATVVIVIGSSNAAKDTASTPASDTPLASSSTTPAASTSANTSTASLKDGSYSATGSYQTPGGQEQISVQVTLAGGVINDASVTQQGKTGEAQEYQDKFVSGFKSQVVGKKISDVSLSRVAGSSLTSIGFNSAIGTNWLIETPVALSSELKNVITKRIDDFDAVYSRFRDDSIVDRAARIAGTYTFPDDSVDLVRLYEQLYVATNGAVTPLVGDALSALGYDKNYSLMPGQPAAIKDWRSVMHWDKTNLTIQQPVPVKAIWLISLPRS